LISLVLVLTIVSGGICANLHSHRLLAIPPLEFEQNKSKDLDIILTVGENAAPNRITIRWVMKNISNADVTILKNGYYGGYELEVTDDERRPVPLTKDGENAWLSGFFVSHRNYVTLKPGDEDKCEADINRMFKLQGQHHYRVVVKRQHRGNDVTSNTAEISVD
jgi:hypothetical protein